jgi:hypothetical protein
MDPAGGVDHGQVAEVDGLLDPATLDADEWGGQLRHRAEYKEGSPATLDAE